MMRRGWRAIAFPAQRYRSAHWLVRGSGIVGCAAHRRRHFFTRGGNGNADDHHGADARTRTHTDEGVLFPYPAALVLHVVTDVANYREFVPWCVDSRVLPAADAPPADVRGAAPATTTADRHTEFFGELSVGFKLFAERYVSRVTIRSDADDAWPATVTAEAINTGLFEHLRNRWVLRAGPRGAAHDCFLDFYVDFRFHSAVYSHASGLFFDEVVTNMNAAFLERCGAVEGAWRAAERRRRRRPAAAAQQQQQRQPAPFDPDTADDDDLLRGWPGGDGGVTPPR